jgi:hypothetical protein
MYNYELLPLCYGYMNTFVRIVGPRIRCSVGAVYSIGLVSCLYCFTLLMKAVLWNRMSCLSVSTILFFWVLFHLNPNFFKTRRRFDLLPENAMSSTKGRFTLYVTFPFRHWTSPFSKIFSCIIKGSCSHWQERLRPVSVAEREWLTWCNVSGRVSTCSIPRAWKVFRLLHYTSSACLQTSAVFS